MVFPYARDSRLDTDLWLIHNIYGVDPHLNEGLKHSIACRIPGRAHKSLKSTTPDISTGQLVCLDDTERH